MVGVSEIVKNVVSDRNPFQDMVGDSHDIVVERKDSKHSGNPSEKNKVDSI